MRRLSMFACVGFVIGSLVPLFWGILSMILFTLPEGPASRAFWKAVYFTCPFWRLDSAIAMFLLNGMLYAVLALVASTLPSRQKKA